MPSSFSLSLRFSAYLGALFLTLGVYLPFWPVFLEAKGLTVGEIGVVMAAASWIRLLGVPLWGRVADPPGRGRPTLILLALASALFYAAFFVIEGYVAALIAHLLIGFVFGALIPLGDSQILQAMRQVPAGDRPIDYGRIRLWGSATFVLGNLLGGWLIALANPDWYLASVVLPLVATAVAAWTLPRRPAERSGVAAVPVRALLKNRAFLVLVLVACLLQASHGAYYVISALAWRAAGFSDQLIAWLWVEGVVAEILLLAYGKHLLRRFPALVLLAAGALGGILRWSLTAATDDLYLLLFAQALHALSFAVVHLATVMEIGRIVPPSRMASAQALMTAAHAGIFISLSMALAAWLYELEGAGAAYGAMAGLSALGLALLLLLRRPLQAAQTVP